MLDLENVGQDHVASFDGKYLTFYLMAKVMFALSLAVFEILMSEIFYLEQEH